MIGQTIQHYEILAELGRGGMGAVYEARDTRLDRRVAIKALPDQAAGSPTAVERFQREARTASALNHPGIVTIHDIFEDAGRRFIVMERIEGETLRELMRRSVPPARGAELVAQVARALAAAHAAGIVHRDLKPENIMVREDGFTKILDFGLARLGLTGDSEAATVAATTPGEIMGTVPYMSPEQCRDSRVGSTSDIFSLGVVLYELVTGQHPFRAESKVACMHRITTDAPVTPSRLNPGLPGDMDDLLARMLDKRPGGRPTAAEVAEELGGAPRPAAPAPSRRPGPPAVVVGRSDQEALMEKALDEAASRHGRVLCVTAEPGIGKTTVVEDFLARLEERDRRCLIARGRCSERLAGSEAYLPLLEALESLLRGSGGDRIAETMKTVAPTWYFRLAPLASDDTSAARLLEDARASSQERMKRELLAIFQELSRWAPLVLFLDDIHWADPSTTDFLAYLGARSDDLALLTLVTFRPSDLLLAEHPFVGVKRELQSRGVCREIGLGFLDRSDVARYLDLELPGHALSEEFVSFLHARTEGSPLFLVNLLGDLRRSGALVESGGWHVVKDLAEIEKEVPASVRSLIEHKIDKLDEADRRLMVAASVQGETFHASVVAAALEMDEVEVEERLDVLERVHALVRATGEVELPDGSLTVRYAFVHALYQNALHATLTPARRAALSRAVATALTDRHGEQWRGIASGLALLHEAARDFARASDCFLEASRQAGRVHANHEAVDLGHRAMASARRLKGIEQHRRVLDAARDLAGLLLTLSRFEESADFFETAEKAAVEAGLEEERIRAICGRGMALYNLKRMEECLSEGERALALAQEIGSELGAASAENVLAAYRLIVGDLREAEDHYARAGRVMEKRADLPTEAIESVVYRGSLHTWKGEFDLAYPIFEKALAAARERGLGFAIAAVHFMRSLALGNHGRLGEALADLREARRLAELNQERYWLPRIPNTMGWVLEELGDSEQALILNLENVELARELEMEEGEANAHVNLAHLYLGLDEHDRAWSHLEKAREIYRRDIWFRWRYNVRTQAELARYWTARGDLEKARQHAVECRQAAEKCQSRKYLAWSRKLEADILLLEDRPEEAAARLDDAMGIFANHPHPTTQWKLLATRREAARLLGRQDDADAFRGRARALVERLAASVPEDRLRQRFLRSRAVRDL